MGCELKMCFMVFILSLVSNLRPSLVHAESQVPCLFIFGDSLVDNGNNNGLQTSAKANYKPYGIDFPGGPTGRFTNGRNMADFIAQFLGFSNFIPPFATASGREILTGVNYGSGGAGIRDETGQQLGDRISMNKQLENHNIVISRSTLFPSRTAATDYLSKCMYYVGMGSNDYINNYLMPESYPTSGLYTPDRLCTTMEQGRWPCLGFGPIGCTPAEIATYGTKGSNNCVDKINLDVELFNIRLKSLVDELNKDLSNAKFTYINITGIAATSPSLPIPKTPCCDVTKYGQCVPDSVPCFILLRAVSEFFDAFHPTEVANSFVAARSYNALLPSDAFPFDIRRLAQL